jgi:hypothetical protein
MNNTSNQFTMLKDHKRIAFDSYIAIWYNENRHVIIGAASLEALEDRWLQITGLVLESSNAQHVRIIQAKQ